MKQLFMYSRKYWIHMIAAAVSSVASSVAAVMVIDILREMIDGIAQGSLKQNIIVTGIKMAGVLIAGMLSNYLVVALTGYIGSGFLKNLRNDSLKSVMNASPESIQLCDYGDLMERMSEDIEGLAGFVSGYFKDCLYVPMITFVYSVYLIVMEPGLAMLCLFPLLIMVPLNVKFMKPIKLRQFQYTKELGLTNNHIEQAFVGAEVIKSYNLQQRMEETYYKALKKTFDTSNDTDLRQYHMEPISRAIQEVPLAIAVCVGGAFVFSGNITIGILIAYISAIKKLIDPLSSAYQLIVRSQTAMVSISRVFDVMKMPPENNEEKDVVWNRKRQEILRFDHVSFRYGADDDKAIHDITFSIGKGQRAAFVGKSGSGKSTILKLIARQVNTDTGKITYCGADYQWIAPKKMRREMALIAQETDLFPMSIADNIRVGNPDMTREQIRKVLDLAGCEEFVNGMSEGMDTVLAEKGSNLSGGQRQRLAIARAIAKDADVLLLDEPTSALDKDTEKVICRTIEKISKDKTVITVAHRLPAIKDYDKIFVLEKGRIIEQGNHSELIKQQGIYYQMYNEFEKTEGRGQ